MDWREILGNLLKTSGGAPTTVDMGNQYQKYNTNTQLQGENPLAWEQWLASQGYMIGPNGQVFPKQQTLTGQSSLNSVPNQ